MYIDRYAVQYYRKVCNFTILPGFSMFLHNYAMFYDIKSAKFAKRLGLCPRPRWGSLQRFPFLPSIHPSIHPSAPHVGREKWSAESERGKRSAESDLEGWLCGPSGTMCMQCGHLYLCTWLIQYRSPTSLHSCYKTRSPLAHNSIFSSE